MPRRFEGKTVLITGAGGGQGRAGARLFANEGARLALTDVDTVALAETVRAVGTTTEVASVPADLSEPAEIGSMVGELAARLGGIDVVYHNAGINHVSPIEDVSEADWDRVHNINARSGFFLVQQAMPALRKSGSGAVVNVSSGAALLAPADGNALYCSSKGAVVSLTRAQARDLAPYGIRVNCILPGPTATPMVTAFFDSLPESERAERRAEVLDRSLLKRFAQPEEIAAVALFLASEEASYITGAVIAVDGGWTSV